MGSEGRAKSRFKARDSRRVRTNDATRVDVVLPLYNEAKQVEGVIRRGAIFASEHTEYRFTFVDDGSADGTPELVRALLRELAQDNLRLIAMPRNSGKFRAIRAGFERSTAKVVCFTDGDLAYSLDHLPRLVEALKHADVAIGSRDLVGADEGRPGVLRRFTGKSFNALARGVLAIPYRDTQAGLKGFRTAAARKLFGKQRLRDFCFDAETLFLARRLGLRIVEVPAKVSPSHSAKRSSVKVARDSVRMLAGLVRVRLNQIRGRYD